MAEEHQLPMCRASSGRREGRGNNEKQINQTKKARAQELGIEPDLLTVYDPTDRGGVRRLYMANESRDTSAGSRASHDQQLDDFIRAQHQQYKHELDASRGDKKKAVKATTQFAKGLGIDPGMLLAMEIRSTEDRFAKVFYVNGLRGLTSCASRCAY